MTSGFLPKKLSKIQDVVVFFAFQASRLTATRLQKLIYLAELRAIERLGKRLTKARFLNYDYGPWSKDVALVADGFEHEDIEVKKSTYDGHEVRMYKPSVNETEILSLTDEEIDILKEVLADWKYRKTNHIVREAKETEPFVWSKYGEEIDFDAYLKCCKELYHNPEIRKLVEKNKKAKGKMFSSVKELTKALASE